MVYPLNDDSPSPLFVRTDSSEIKLGDYGRLYSAGGGAFKRQGNIFDLATELGMQASIEPVRHEIDHKNCEMLGDIIVKVTRPAPLPGRLIFRSATGMSLPNNQDVVSSLFARLAGPCLVTTLVVCFRNLLPRGYVGAQK